ncbi:class I SAM-dependent methyltransferase [Janibacter sp. YB324]|uniref:class I SAM-dependent methyltransferase n=1 Tax=Janibacter sp. YB324 TaxID=2761047 RepID=UPI0016245476|nr:class I SAM-dependent methyltransferase [Janibacter sp. YB324]QNF95517.1 class I SAM-dependent methyltransferase [Janibacter sp. YB324]
METIRWVDRDRDHEAEWHSESGAPVPERVVVADDTMTADAAMRLASRGTAILWRGDYHNARQLLKAMDRRIERRASRRQRGEVTFAGHRAERTQRATLLAHLVVELGPDRSLDLRRAPDVREACWAAYGPGTGPMVVALSELLGVIGAHQWQTKGVHVPALGASIHPAYGVFSPVRGEYIDLVANAPLAQPVPRTAFDLGTGTGVLAVVLAQRGVERVVATDINPRAVACARDNAQRLGVGDRVEAVEADLYPDGRADLVVCNPPWLPGEPTSDLEAGIYDPGSDMLRRFLSGLAEHLEPGGEGWLVISDLAEHLGLRAREELLGLIDDAGLEVVDRLETVPRHQRASDAKDSLHAARRAEVTSLWRLTVAQGRQSAR